jgi:thiamine kinase-like enzyme
MVVSFFDDKVNLNEGINGHSITIGWLLDSLRQNDKVYQKLHGKRSVKEVKAYDVSVGKGFASEILRCILTFVDSESSDDVYTTILKIPGFESMKEISAKNGSNAEWLENKETMKGFDLVHEFECNFYDKLAPIFDVPVPKVFKTLLKTSDIDGCIHMEDLTLRGKTLTFFDNLNLTQVKHIIRLLAHMHKNILLSDSETWEGKYLETQKTIANVIDLMKPMTKAFKKKCKNSALLNPLYDRCQKMSESKDFFIYVFTEAYKNLKPVIVHGDLHQGNIMWAIDENGDVQNNIAAIIDWQTILEGSPMIDLSRILTMCCSGSTRREAEIWAIDFYLECLTKEFNGDITKVPYTATNLKHSYNLAFLIQAFMTMGGTAFGYGAIEERNIPQEVKESIWDEGQLKVLHVLQDADRLLQNELKDFYEKYGL